MDRARDSGVNLPTRCFRPCSPTDVGAAETCRVSCVCTRAQRCHGRTIRVGPYENQARAAFNIRAWLRSHARLIDTIQTTRIIRRTRRRPSARWQPLWWSAGTSPEPPCRTRSRTGPPATAPWTGATLLVHAPGTACPWQVPRAGACGASPWGRVRRGGGPARSPVIKPDAAAIERGRL